MASSHFTAKVGTRGQGHSAVEASAYRARAEVTDNRTGLIHDYTRNRNACLWSGIFAPKNAPDWTRDSAQLWNHVEAFEKNGRAALYREVEVALPHELTLKQNEYLLRDWIKENVTRKGLICEAFIHAPPRGGDERNIHAHIMVTTRPLDGSEFIAKKPSTAYANKGEAYAAKKEQLAAEKASWEKIANRHLERHGFEGSIYLGRKQNGDEPTIHLGKKATAQERDGLATDRGDINRAIIEENARRRAANENAPEPISRTVEPPSWFQEQAPPPPEADQAQAPDLLWTVAADSASPDPRDLARGRTEDGSVIYLHQPPTGRVQEPPAWFEEHAPPPHEEAQERDEAALAPTLAPEPPEAAHAPENRLGEAPPARPSYLPPIVINLPYEPDRMAYTRFDPTSDYLPEHIMRPAREAQAEARAGREEATQETIAKVEARIAEADRQEAEKTPEQLAAEREAYRQEQEATKLGPVSANPADFRSVWDEVRDHTKAEPEEKPTNPRGLVESTEGPELPEMNFRPGMIFIGKCLEWGIAMAGRIVDAIASIFEERDNRRQQRPEPMRFPAPPPPPPQLPPKRPSLLDEARAELEAERKMTPQQREAVDRLRDVLRDPDNTRHRGHHR